MTNRKADRRSGRASTEKTGPKTFLRRRPYAGMAALARERRIGFCDQDRGRMGEWIKCGKGFIEADVIRWQEGAFEDEAGAAGRRRSGRRRRPVLIGDRRVTAQLLEEDKRAGYVKLRVVRCVEKPLPGRRRNVQMHIPAGTETKRAIKTILNGGPERLRSPDESARLAAVRQRIREKGGYLISIPRRAKSPPRLERAFGRARAGDRRPAVKPGGAGQT